jgi:hypothetical protein
METKTALAVGEALFTHFSALQELIGEPLRAVWHIASQGCLDQVILDLGPIALVVSADPDDSIDFRCMKTSDPVRTDSVDASHHQCWQSSIGVPFGWAWVTVNQQGYCDGLLLSFGDIVPQVVMNVIASEIRLRRISMTATA